LIDRRIARVELFNIRIITMLEGVSGRLLLALGGFGAGGVLSILPIFGGFA
jgi:hypothetical protein